jgi:hypothetical protein
MSGKKHRKLHGDLLFNVVSLLTANIGKLGTIWVDHETGQQHCTYVKDCSDKVIAEMADPKGRVNEGQVQRLRSARYGLLKRKPEPKAKLMKAASRSMSSKEATDLYRAMHTVINQNRQAHKERMEMSKNIALLISTLLPTKQVALDLDNEPTDIYKLG